MHFKKDVILNFNLYFYILLFLFISYFNIFIIKELLISKFSTFNIFLISSLHSILSIVSIKYYLSKFDYTYIKNKFNNLSIKKNKFIIILFIILIIFPLFYIKNIEQNNYEYLFYEISTKIEFRKPFTILFKYKNFIAATLYILSIFIFFYILRVFKINKSISIILSLIFFSSQTHLYNLFTSPFRDYIKAPIILLITLFFLKLIILKNNNNIKFKYYNLILILLLYFGLFLRADILIFHFFYFLIIISLVIKNGEINFISLKNYIQVILLYIVVMLTHLATIIYLKTDSIILPATIINTINFNLQIFNQNYNSGYIFIDEYIRNLIYLENDYALNYLTYFPFDFLIKILASMKNILQLPFIYKLPPPGIDNQLILTFYEIKYNFLFIFKYIIFLVTLYSFFILLRQYKYSGFLCIILFLFFMFYPVIQHQIKHYFYLEFLPLLYLGLVINNFLKKYEN